MNVLEKLFHRHSRNDIEQEAAELLAKQTGDPAYMHQVNWTIAMGHHDYATALGELNAALAIVPTNPRYLTLRAMTHYQLGNYMEANIDLRGALRINPSEQEAVAFLTALQSEARECRDRARETSKRGDRRASVPLLDKACALEPDNPENFAFRGATLGQLGEFRRAIDDFNRTLELNPQYPNGREVLQALKNMERDSRR